MKVIVLIALFAMARKFIIMDCHETAAETMLGLAAITLALGIVCWLLRERDDRLQSQDQRYDPNLSMNTSGTTCSYCIYP